MGREEGGGFRMGNTCFKIIKLKIKKKKEVKTKKKEKKVYTNIKQICIYTVYIDKANIPKGYHLLNLNSVSIWDGHSIMT